MYLPGKILKLGTSVDPDQAIRPSAATAYVLDMTAPAPQQLWRQVHVDEFRADVHEHNPSAGWQSSRNGWRSEYKRSGRYKRHKSR